MTYRILQGDVIKRLRDLHGRSVDCVVTSPPYWGLRDYGVSGQIGLEATPAEYIAKMVDVFREVRRVLRKDGTCWINMGDKRSVWNVPTQAFPEAHFATFPEKLIEPCILAGSPEGGLVLDPFSGSGTTGVVALRNRREYVGIELSEDYAAMSERRILRAITQLGTEVTA